ncbi:MAG: GntR family transcriptional regulator [Paracoccaceae bacterium]|nr:GntR family transcriptional regulator [Paracoccaceae bacterium]
MTQTRLAPIDQSKLRETVYDALKQAFTRGAFAPGDVMSLRDLAQQLTVSMTPVREAVRRLVAEGALIDTPSRTLMVPAFDERRMHDLKSARLALELLALEQSMAHMDDETILALEACLTSAGNTPDLDANYRFHFTLYQCGGSEILLPMIEALWMQYGAYLNLIMRQETIETIEQHTYHFEILSALKSGDQTSARDALTRDIERSFGLLQPEINKGSRHD